MVISLALWLWDYINMALTEETDELVNNYYLEPFFFFCVGLLFDMTRLSLIIVAIKDP
jgi:hypothetical protein